MGEKNRPSPIPAPAPASVRSLDEARRKRQVPPGEKIEYIAGDTIKYAGEAEPAMFVVVRGRVALVREVETELGPVVHTIENYAQGEPFNTCGLFAKTDADTANEYRALEDTVIVRWSLSDALKDWENYVPFLETYVLTVTRHDGVLRDRLVRALADKIGAERRARGLEVAFENTREELEETLADARAAEVEWAVRFEEQELVLREAQRKRDDSERRAHLAEHERLKNAQVSADLLLGHAQREAEHDRAMIDFLRQHTDLDQQVFDALCDYLKSQRTPIDDRVRDILRSSLPPAEPDTSRGRTDRPPPLVPIGDGWEFNPPLKPRKQ
jgi:CRP-like cAMP-binding protein